MAVYPKTVWSFFEIGFDLTMGPKVLELIQDLSPQVMRAHAHNLTEDI